MSARGTKIGIVAAIGLLVAVLVAREIRNDRVAEERARQAFAQREAAKVEIAPRVRERLAVVQRAIEAAKAMPPLESPRPRPAPRPKVTKKNTSVVGSGEDAPFEDRIGVDAAKLESGSFDLDEAIATLQIEHVIVLVSREHRDPRPDGASFRPGSNIADAYLFDVVGADAVARGGFRFRGENEEISVVGTHIVRRRRPDGGTQDITVTADEGLRANLNIETRLAFAETLKAYLPGTEWW